MWKVADHPGSEIRRAVAITVAPLTAFQPTVLHARASRLTASPQSQAETSGSLAGAKPSRASPRSQVVEDPLRAILRARPQRRRSVSAKPMLETPRAVSFVGKAQDQSLRHLRRRGPKRARVPGTPYDDALRACKAQINVRERFRRHVPPRDEAPVHEGPVRTVLSAMDGIEVVKKPPSPSRHGQDRQLHEHSCRRPTAPTQERTCRTPKGFLQGTTGSYMAPFRHRSSAARRPAQGVRQAGRLLRLASPAGGLGLLRPARSASTAALLPGHDASIEEAIGPFRAEVRRTAAAVDLVRHLYMNRIAQDSIDKSTYITGSPLVNLDLNGDGRIGYVEKNLPFAGARKHPGATTEALNQRRLACRWSGQSRGAGPSSRGRGYSRADAAGISECAPPDQLPVAAQVMRAMPAGGPLPPERPASRGHGSWIRAVGTASRLSRQRGVRGASRTRSRRSTTSTSSTTSILTSP